MKSIVHENIFFLLKQVMFIAGSTSFFFFFLSLTPSLHEYHRAESVY